MEEHTAGGLTTKYSEETCGECLWNSLSTAEIYLLLGKETGLHLCKLWLWASWNLQMSLPPTHTCCFQTATVGLVKRLLHLDYRSHQNVYSCSSQVTCANCYRVGMFVSTITGSDFLCLLPFFLQATPRTSDIIILAVHPGCDISRL